MEDFFVHENGQLGGSIHPMFIFVSSNEIDSLNKYRKIFAKDRNIDNFRGVKKQ